MIDHGEGQASRNMALRTGGTYAGGGVPVFGFLQFLVDSGFHDMAHVAAEGHPGEHVVRQVQRGKCDSSDEQYDQDEHPGADNAAEFPVPPFLRPPESAALRCRGFRLRSYFRFIIRHKITLIQYPSLNRFKRLHQFSELQ